MTAVFYCTGKGEQMKKIKNSVIYILSVMFVMGLFAAFETSGLYQYADRLNLQPDRMYLAFTDKADELSAFVSQEDYTPDTTGKAESYKLGDNSPFIREYKMILFYLDIFQIILS